MATTQELNLKATSREAGKHQRRDLRKNNFVPAVVYGPKTKPISLFIGMNDAVKYGRHGFENSIFTLESENKDLNGMKVLRKSIDIHPVSRRPIHMDFFAPDMTQAVRVEIEVRISGKAIGTTEGGLVSLVRRTVEIECLPLEIPEYFDLDITNLGLDESMHVSDIQFPENIKVISSMDETLVSCAIVKEEEIIPVATAETAAAGATPAAGAAGAAAPAAGAATTAAPAGEQKK